MNCERSQVVVVAYLSYFSVFVGGTEENHKKFSVRDCWFLRRDSNPGPPEYEARALTRTPRRLARTATNTKIITLNTPHPFFRRCFPQTYEPPSQLATRTKDSLFVTPASLPDNQRSYWLRREVPVPAGVTSTR